MAEYNGTNMIFDSENEQVTFELNKLIQCSEDPQFTSYLKSSLDELKDYSDPMKLRDKIVENYNIYAQRMIRYGKTVDTVYNHAVYGEMSDPEIKSPYSNESPYSNTSPYSNESSNIIQRQSTTNNSPLKILGYIGGLFAIYVVLFIVALVLLEYMDPTDVGTTALINIVYTLIVGFSLYLGNTKLSILIENKKSLIIAFISALIMAATYFTLSGGGFLVTLAVCLGTFPPLYSRKKELTPE